MICNEIDREQQQHHHHHRTIARTWKMALSRGSAAMAGLARSVGAKEAVRRSAASLPHTEEDDSRAGWESRLGRPPWLTRASNGSARQHMALKAQLVLVVAARRCVDVLALHCIIARLAIALISRCVSPPWRRLYERAERLERGFPTMVEYKGKEGRRSEREGPRARLLCLFRLKR